MIDFSTLQGLAIPEGVVTQIAKDGVILWAVKSGSKVVLQVEKITHDTFAGETTYTGEQFVLLDIYPKTNGTVSVTYGGLTKTITDTSGAESPNAQQVFFGTFNGVTDSMATPTSGELTIEGNVGAFAIGQYKEYSSKLPSAGSLVRCNCITAVIDWGDIKVLPSYAFYGCTGLTSINIPDGVTNIESYAFYGCTGLTSINIPNSVKNIESYAFYGCNGITSVVVPNGVVSIKDNAFNACANLANLTLPATLQTIGTYVAAKAATAGNCNITVVVLATTPPTCESEKLHLVQQNLSGNTIIVPKGCLNAYKTAVGWSQYATITSGGNQVTMKEAS